MSTHPFASLQPDDFVLEGLPDDVFASIEVRDSWVASLPPAEDGLEFLVSDFQAWTPGQVLRVAFFGGDTALYKDIEKATQEIQEACNIKLDFGSPYRTWSPNDAEPTAEIRVSFDQKGYFSLVGTDSTNPNIGAPGGAVGGSPNQRSLNLGGFHLARPATWIGTARHEFLHALGFHHEHQNNKGPCQEAFRWDDDRDYQPTRDNRGMYIPDGLGRRPGIYTYLAGFPNFWTKSKIDHNLRTPPNIAQLRAGVFDNASVMLYRFPDLFYKENPSPCAPAGNGQSLSVGDKEGLARLYPNQTEALGAIGSRRETLLQTLEPPKGLESAELDGASSPILDASIEILRKSVELLRP